MEEEEDLEGSEKNQTKQTKKKVGKNLVRWHRNQRGAIVKERVIKVSNFQMITTRDFWYCLGVSITPIEQNLSTQRIKE